MTAQRRLLTTAAGCLAFASLAAAGRAADAPAAASEPSLARVPDAAAFELAKSYNREMGGKTLVVMLAGKVIFEDYANGGSAAKPEPIASGSKGFVGAAALAAVEDGLLKLDDPAYGAIAEWANDPEKSKITYRQLLTLTSGLTPRSPSGGGRNVPSWKEVIALPLAGKPGAQFAYGETHLVAFAYALEQKLGGETFEAYLKRRALDPIGITATWALKCAD
ncbi:MAG: serine hydrolase, partial [Candidatus Sumerlaeota bacterium]|nr:serine hydrolase [Candidatus Sumerlaeota bacterium]